MNSSGAGSGPPHVCPWWCIRTFDNPLRRIVQNPRTILDGMIRPGDSCLDIGCGIGYFTIPMATLVGPTGSVTAVDVQSHMLDGVLKRARRARLESRIRVHLANTPGLPFSGAFDFALAFWMLHEVSDQSLLLSHIRRALKPRGLFLLVEPRGHVTHAEFDRSLHAARETGFTLLSGPKVFLSRGALLYNEPESAA
jgi:ubiquinone/menaquinone biosynthesis C-methylase UbiE